MLTWIPGWTAAGVVGLIGGVSLWYGVQHVAHQDALVAAGGDVTMYILVLFIFGGLVPLLLLACLGLGLAWPVAALAAAPASEAVSGPGYLRRWLTGAGWLLILLATTVLVGLAVAGVGLLGTAFVVDWFRPSTGAIRPTVLGSLLVLGIGAVPGLLTLLFATAVHGEPRTRPER